MRTRLIPAVLALVVFSAGLLAGSASAADRADAEHREFYFRSYDALSGVNEGINRLHADVLRPEGTDWTTPMPVILTVSPYTNHSVETPEFDGSGPSPRFYDFLDLSGVLRNGYDGYTYVMVDLPGDGGSGGCNDWGGAREQSAVAAAVEWAAAQPWSNGNVALLGKSYDGWTGLMGIAQQPKGLAAVVSLEPVYSGYRYIWMNGIRRNTTWPYGTGFTQTDIQPGRFNNPEYVANSAPQAWCYPINIVGQSGDDSETGPYWAERNLVPTAFGKTTPLFLTQGFLETNTKQDGTFEYFDSLAGDEHRAWYGQFDHCRAWETQGACSQNSNQRLAVGRPGFMDEVMRFLDEHLKGVEPTVDDPTIEVQDNLGRWRAEESWPPSDMTLYETELRSGTYTDSGSGRGDRPSANQGIWSISEPLAHDVWFSGEPYLTVSVEAVPNANLAANVYDIDPDGGVTMISRGVQLLRGTGIRNFNLTLYGQDWRLEEGHRVGVLISGANTDQFQYPVPTRQPVTVRYATIRLPFLTNERVEFLEGGSTPRLEAFLNGATASLTAEVIAGAETAFELPGPLVQPPVDPIDTVISLAFGKRSTGRVVRATLAAMLDGSPIEGRAIAFYLNGEPIGEVTTDASGRAEISLTADQLGAGDVVRAAFAGDELYDATEAEKAR